MENARKVIAEKINAKPDEIIFTSSGSEGNSFVLSNFKVAIVDSTSHKSSLRHRNGNQIVDDFGFIELEALNLEILRKKYYLNKILVSICGANNEIGTIQPIKEIAEIVHKYSNVFIHVDGVQLLPDTPIDVKDLDVDFMTFSGAKIGCPAGIGFMYIKKSVQSLVRHLIKGTQEFGLRGGTENVPYILGLAKAVELIDYSKRASVVSLRDYFINQLLRLPDTYLVGASPQSIIGGESDYRLANNINICFHGIDASALLNYLNIYGVYASGGSACNSSELESSHVLRAICLPSDDQHSCIRFSISEDTTVDELNQAYEIIKRFVLRFKTHMDNKEK